MTSGAPSRESPLKRLLKQGGIYALGNVAIKASGLILAPLYLNDALLAQAAFGQLVMLEATAQLMIPVVGLGLATGMLKFMADPALGEEARAVPLTTLIPTILAAGVMVMVLWPLAPAAAELGLDGRQDARIVHLLLIYVALKVIGMVPLTLMRVKERALLYVIAVLAETLVLIGGVYYALAMVGAGLEGVMLAYAASAGISAAVLTAGMLSQVEWRFRPGIARRLVAFGAPLAAAGIALPILRVGDRYIMEWLSTTEELAVYGWAARLSGILNMLVVQSFQLAFAVIGIKELGDREEGAVLHRRAFRHYSVWAGWAALGLALFSYDATALLSSTPAYLGAAPMVLPLALGLVLYGLYVIATNVLYAHGRTRIVASSVFLAALLNVLLNLVLIPSWGGMGASVATMLSYAALGFITLRISERYLKIHFSYRIMIYVLLAIGSLWFASLLAYEWPVMLRLAYFALLFVLYAVLMVLTRVYPWADVRAFIRGGFLARLMRRQARGE